MPKLAGHVFVNRYTTAAVKREALATCEIHIKSRC